MKVKKSLVVVLSVLVVLLAIVLTNNNLLSTIGDLNAQGPRCDTAYNGGSCEMMLKLSANKKLDPGYSLDILVKPLIEENYTDKIELQPLDSKEVIKTSSYGTKEKRTYYLYQLPSGETFDNVKLTSELDNIKIFPNDENKITIIDKIGYVNVNYPMNYIDLCTETDYTKCTNTTLVRAYSVDGLQQANDYHINFVKYDELYGSYSTGNKQGNVIVDGIVKDDNLNFNNKKIIVEVIERVKNGNLNQNYQLSKPLKLYVQFLPKHIAKDLVVSIGDKNIITYSGAVTGRKYLPDLSSDINNYCNRNDEYNSNDKECIIPLKFTSKDGTEVVVLSELGELSNYESQNLFNKITINVNNQLLYLLLGAILILSILIGVKVMKHGNK